jgi:hypothetical protein
MKSLYEIAQKCMRADESRAQVVLVWWAWLDINHVLLVYFVVVPVKPAMCKFFVYSIFNFYHKDIKFNLQKFSAST